MPCNVTRRGTGAPYIVDANGYMRFRVNDRGVYAHRYIMELLLGRPLLTSEHVHHKDGDKLNNFPDNLELLSATAHAKEHVTSERAKQLSIRGHAVRWGKGV